ncbi:MAG: hypothetical protein ACK5P7_09445 [Bdellovibrio sp.]|jgi:hypothetical protein
MIKLGAAANLASLSFWRSLNLQVDWVEAPYEELFARKDLRGIFVNPDDSEAILDHLKRIPRSIQECGFVDFIEMTPQGPNPKNFLRENGVELFARGTRTLDNRKKAYISGSGPWAKLFCVIAVQMGFQSLLIVVTDKSAGRFIAEELRRFCFGVDIDLIQHSELTLRPNDGSLLVNTVDPHEYPDVIADLSYLNFLSLEGLVVETHETIKENTLVLETKNSRIALIEASVTQAFFEAKAFSLFPGLLPWSLDEYAEKRKTFLMK